MPSEPPPILAFDTSAAHCAAALLGAGLVLAERREAMARGQAERLLPMLEELLEEARLGWNAIGAIGVGTGPGNFTGLRIGVAAARGLALGLGRPAIGVTRFAALAEAAPGAARGAVLVTIEAPGAGLYAQRFRDGAEEGMPELAAAEGVAAAAGTLCLRHGAAAIAARIGGERGPETTLPDPASIARIVARRLKAPQPPPAPLYIRPADAAPAAEAPARILDDA
ncbi:tRNA (adenosine(37)-N6)-threonylcarbamoyltransferase complex dimerization subunit type 1 TsaB [soil metagenome]